MNRQHEVRPKTWRFCLSRLSVYSEARKKSTGSPIRHILLLFVSSVYFSKTTDSVPSDETDSYSLRDGRRCAIGGQSYFISSVQPLLPQTDETYSPSRRSTGRFYHSRFCPRCLRDSRSPPEMSFLPPLKPRYVRNERCPRSRWRDDHGRPRARHWTCIGDRRRRHRRPRTGRSRERTHAESRPLGRRHRVRRRRDRRGRPADTDRRAERRPGRGRRRRRRHRLTQPAPDNGIKLWAADGRAFDEDENDRIAGSSRKRRSTSARGTNSASTAT